MKVIITGASGFIGNSLATYMEDHRHEVVRLTRNPKLNEFKLPNTKNIQSWSSLLGGVDSFVHLAGRAHILDDNVPCPLDEFRKVNVDWTIDVAKLVLNSDVKRFIYFSSLGVLGSESNDKPFTEISSPNPRYDYAKSKLEAEQKLTRLFASTNKELVIIRPPLVYSHSAPGNFGRLLVLASTLIPFPFSGVHNRRSLISLYNLVHFTELCCKHPKAANQTFVISDDEVLSTAEIVKNLRLGMHNKVPVFYFPKIILELMFKITGLIDTYNKVFGSLEVNNEKAKALLGWKPPESTYESLITTGTKYKNK
jgi:nucleoside-diphosphate-sugar epimerase